MDCKAEKVSDMPKVTLLEYDNVGVYSQVY